MDLRKPFNNDADEFLDNAAFLVLRLGLGFGMLFGHGYDKLKYLFGDEPIEFMEQTGSTGALLLGLVVFAEFFCSIFLILGLFTRWAAFFLLITMCVAVFFVHFGHPFPKEELGYLYLVGFVAIFLAGGGDFSLDEKMGRSH